MLCCTFLYVSSSFEIILMGKRAGCFAKFVFLVSRDCYVWLFLAVPLVSLQFVIVFFLSILTYNYKIMVKNIVDAILSN